MSWQTGEAEGGGDEAVDEVTLLLDHHSHVPASFRSWCVDDATVLLNRPSDETCALLSVSLHSSPSSVSGSAGSANSNSYPFAVFILSLQQWLMLPCGMRSLLAASIALSYVVQSSVPTFLPRTGLERRPAFDLRLALLE